MYVTGMTENGREYAVLSADRKSILCWSGDRRDASYVEPAEARALIFSVKRRVLRGTHFPIYQLEARG